MALDEQELSEDLLWGDDGSGSEGPVGGASSEEEPEQQQHTKPPAPESSLSKKHKPLDIAGVCRAVTMQPSGPLQGRQQALAVHERKHHYAYALPGAGVSSASHQSSTLRASLEEELAASGPTPSPPVDVPGGFRARGGGIGSTAAAAAAGADGPHQLPHFGKPQQQPYTRLVSWRVPRSRGAPVRIVRQLGSHVRRVGGQRWRIWEPAHPLGLHSACMDMRCSLLALHQHTSAPLTCFPCMDHHTLPAWPCEQSTPAHH